MALNNVSLNKLLKILPRTLRQREAMIRKDARDAVLRERKVDNDDGGDFYGVFWSDAKKFILKGASLKDLVREQVRKSKSKRRLYPILLEGILPLVCNSLWRCRPLGSQRNYEGFRVLLNTGRIGAVRVHNLLAWTERDGTKHIVYPYFDKDHALGPRAARFGRWAMTNALQDLEENSMIILDVLRGRAYDNDNCPLLGDEEEMLSERYGRILTEWEAQKRLFRVR